MGDKGMIGFGRRVGVEGGSGTVAFGARLLRIGIIAAMSIVATSEDVEGE